MIDGPGKPNEFGKNRYSIDLIKIYKITIDEDNLGNLVVKNYRRGIFKDKLLYSFTHSSSWESLIPLAIQKLKTYTNLNEKQRFYDHYWEEVTTRCLMALPHLNLI